MASTFRSKFIILTSNFVCLSIVLHLKIFHKRDQSHICSRYGMTSNATCMTIKRNIDAIRATLVPRLINVTNVVIKVPWGIHFQGILSKISKLCTLPSWCRQSIFIYNSSTFDVCFYCKRTAIEAAIALACMVRYINMFVLIYKISLDNIFNKELPRFFN